jgi:cytoskeleton protein RodZ
MSVEHSMSDACVNESTSPNEDGQTDANRQSISPGAQLAACRQERGWTVEQVASQLNLAPRQIAALESDDYPALPGMAIVRGFIRAYAKLLKIDPSPMLAALGGETVFLGDSIAPRKTLSTPFAAARLPTMTERSGLSSKWLFLVLLLLLAGVVLWATHQSGEIAGLSRSASSSVESGLAYLSHSAPTEQKKPEVDPAPTPAPVPAPAASLNGGGAADTSQPENLVPSTSADPAAGALEASPPAESAAPDGKNTLELKINSDSWIEIRRVSNNGIVISRIAKAGTTENVDVDEPVSVVIGNAAGVDASFRGTPLELKSSANNNVARFNLK